MGFVSADVGAVEQGGAATAATAAAWTEMGSTTSAALTAASSAVVEDEGGLMGAIENFGGQWQQTFALLGDAVSSLGKNASGAAAKLAQLDATSALAQATPEAGDLGKLLYRPITGRDSGN